jgi:hypothetical protein
VPLKVGVAAFTLLSSIATLFAKRHRRTLLCGNTADHVKSLSDAHVRAATLREDLNAYLSRITPRIYDEQLAVVLGLVNELVRQVNVALVDLGLETSHA